MRSTVRRSPFIFIKWVVVIQFIFALLPYELALLFNSQRAYEATEAARIIPYNLLVLLLMALIQVIIIVGAFILWQMPSYYFDGAQVLYRFGAGSLPRRLFTFADVTRVEVRQGWLARRFDYGSVIVERENSTRPARLADVPAPDALADQIEEQAARARKAQLAAQPLALPAPRDAATVRDLIAAGEGQHLEFKSSLMWDYRRQAVNKELYEPVMKNLAGFMNATGGTLLLGVGDDGAVLGLEQDWGGLKKPGPDGYENVFNQAFNKMIGVELRRFVRLAFVEVDGKTVGVLDAQPADTPVYLLNNSNAEEFYIRAGNASQPLSLRKAQQYIGARFGPSNGAGPSP
jgi:hypothetical protein